MDYARIIAELHTQQKQVEQAIDEIERLARSRPKRRGRPPKWFSEARIVERSESNSAERVIAAS